MPTYVKVRWEPAEDWIPTELLVELDNDGLSLREVGFDANGNINHRCPDRRYRQGARGFFDDYPLALTDPDRPLAFVVTEATRDEFEEAFAREAEPPRRRSFWNRVWRAVARPGPRG